MPLLVEPGTSRDDPETRPYRPYGACAELFRRRDRELIIEGPADVGKSRACLEKLHAAMTKYPGARGAMVRKTRKSLTATAMATFERFVCPPGAAKLWADQEYRYPNGSKIYLLGLDDAERLKSLEADMAFVQEVSELSIDDWEILSSRVTGRGAVMPYVQLLGDLNPVAPSFWLYEREAAGNTAFLFARHEDNPSITPERLAALDSLTGYRYQRLRLGLRVAVSGLFFEEFDPNLHVIDAFDPPEHWVKWIGIDWGFSAPFVALWAAREKPGGKIYIYREISAPGLRDEQQAQLLIERSAGERIEQVVCDPSVFNARSESQRPSIAAIYARCGVADMTVRGIQPGQNNRRQGWAVVRQALAHDSETALARRGVPNELPRLQLMRQRCPNLIKNLPAMVFDHLDSEDLADVVDHRKTPDDEVDCLRYLLCAEAIATPSEQPVRATFG